MNRREAKRVARNFAATLLRASADSGDWPPDWMPYGDVARVDEALREIADSLETGDVMRPSFGEFYRAAGVPRPKEVR